MLLLRVLQQISPRGNIKWEEGNQECAAFIHATQKNKGESSREKVCKRLFVFVTPKSMICPRYAFASPIPWAVFLLSPAVPAVYRSEEKRTDMTWQSPAKKSSSLVWSPPMQLLFVGAAPLLPGSGRQTIRFDCCVRIKRNYSRSMLSSELFGGCLRCWLHLVGLHWPKKKMTDLSWSSDANHSQERPITCCI